MAVTRLSLKATIAFYTAFAKLSDDCICTAIANSDDCNHTAIAYSDDGSYTAIANSDDCSYTAIANSDDCSYTALADSDDDSYTAIAKSHINLDYFRKRTSHSCKHGGTETAVERERRGMCRIAGTDQSSGQS